MKPIRFTCEETVDTAPEAIAERILDLDRWGDFDGYGVLPGIATAELKLRTSTIVGSRIRVRNTDGSRHIEAIVQWDPPRRVQLDLHELSPPLSRLASASTKHGRSSASASGLASSAPWKCTPVPPSPVPCFGGSPVC